VERGSYIQIADGNIFDPLNPDPDLLTIEVIARALSNQCRFTGHVSEFYSVAEHSVHVSRIVPARLAKRAILHDGSEFAISDLSSPLKNETEMGTLYREVEKPLQELIERKFGVYDGPIPDEIKRADEAMREIERLTLLPRTPEGDELWAEWPADTTLVPASCTPGCWAPDWAYAKFLERWEEVK